MDHQVIKKELHHHEYDIFDYLTVIGVSLVILIVILGAILSMTL
jgi:hypothetical protein